MPRKTYTLAEATKILTDSIIKPAPKDQKFSLTAETAKNLRLELPNKTEQLRKTVTARVKKLFPSSHIQAEKPYVVLLPGEIKVFVKPAKTINPTSQTNAKIKYGFLDSIDLSKYDTTAFQEITPELCRNTLPTTAKEESDVICVSEFNTALAPHVKTIQGVSLSFLGFQFENVIGCVPVTKGEPKADAILIAAKGKTLKPVCFFSYKMGTTAKGFQNYSGLSEKSASEIFHAKETLAFYEVLATICEHKQQRDIAPYRPLKNRDLIGKAVWGMDYGKGTKGINNCHFFAQGTVTITASSGRGNITYSGHSGKNGNFQAFTGAYAPVLGARYTQRNNVGPNGIYITSYRIGIWPQAYFTEGRSSAKLV